MESKFTNFFRPFPLSFLTDTLINYLHYFCQSLRVFYQVAKNGMDIVLDSEKLKLFEFRDCVEIIIPKLYENLLEPHNHNQLQKLQTNFIPGIENRLRKATQTSKTEKALIDTVFIVNLFIGWSHSFIIFFNYLIASLNFRKYLIKHLWTSWLWKIREGFCVVYWL